MSRDKSSGATTMARSAGASLRCSGPPREGEEACPNLVEMDGLCRAHYAQRKAGKKVKPLCTGPARDGIGLCDNPVHATSLCYAHVRQRRRGLPLTPLLIKKAGRAIKHTIPFTSKAHLAAVEKMIGEEAKRVPKVGRTPLGIATFLVMQLELRASEAGYYEAVPRPEGNVPVKVRAYHCWWSTSESLEAVLQLLRDVNNLPKQLAPGQQAPYRQLFGAFLEQVAKERGFLPTDDTPSVAAD